MGILSFGLVSFQCGIFYPADPQFRKIPLQNEEYSGFISRDFFQVVVKVPKTAKPIPIREVREDCKNRAYQERNRITVALLIKEMKELESDQFRGINKIRSKYPKPGSAGDINNQGVPDPSGSNQPIAHPLYPPGKQPQPNLNPSNPSLPSGSTIQPMGNIPDKNPQDLLTQESSANPSWGKFLNQKDLSYLQGDFAWFLDSMKLYKEDYSQKEECVFVFRLAEKELYDKLESTKLSIRWEEYE